MKILIDTNVLIGLEDAGIVEERFADLVRIASTHGISLFVHEASARDVERDSNVTRRASTKSRFAKFRVIKSPRRLTREALIDRFGPFKKDNDEVDALLLDALERNAADILVTEDLGIHRRARAVSLSDRVFTTLEALAWIRDLFNIDAVSLPAVQDALAYEVSFDDAIFDELRGDYEGFDKWTNKCRIEHRPCWVVYEDDTIAGIIIRKDETHTEAGTIHCGPKILKLCTFKVAAASRGRKLGEQLLKQALWHTQRNAYDLIYLTVYPKQESLIWLLEEYGFEQTRTMANGELVYEKPIGRGPLAPIDGETPLAAAKKNYPRFQDGAAIRKFAIPIKPDYHKILFPERSLVTEEDPGRPGNTIRKVYLTHSLSQQMREGDLIFFYLSRGHHPDSQTLTSVGVISEVRRTADFAELVRLTASRSAYPDQDLRALAAHGTVTAIDFLLVGHLEQPLTLTDLVTSGILRAAPQSVTLIRDYPALKRVFDLGFEV